MDNDSGGTIVSRYKRYKAGTKQVVSWLANTAAQHCHLRDILSCLRDAPASQITVAIQVKTHELLALTKVIIAVSTSTVPAGILAVLQDVIDGRQSCAGWYASKTAEDDADMASQNGSHLYFIGILQEIQENLSDLKVTPGSDIGPEKPTNKNNKKKNKSKSGQAANQHDEMRNLFQYLDVEEPVAAPLGTAGPSKSGSADEKLHFELENDAEMDLFALWCHLKDMSDVRLLTKDLWMDYRRGDITIEVAGMSTEIAIGMMAKAHKEFVEIYPQFANWAAIMDFLQLTTCFKHNVIYICPRPGINTLVGQCFHDTTDTKPTDLLCPAAALLLQAYASAVERFEEAGLDPDAVRDQNLWSPTIARPENAFESHLMSSVPEVVMIKHFSVNDINLGVLFVDSLLPLVAFYDVLPLSAVFACQMYIDINDIFDSAPSCAGDALLRTALTVKSSAVLWDTFVLEHLGPPPCGKLPDVALRRASDIEKAIEHARVIKGPHAKRELSAQELRFHRAEDRLPCVDVLPSCAGIVSYGLKTRDHDEGTKVANSGSVVVLLAHFYTAARRYGLLTATWHDLEFLVAQHSGKKPLITKTHANATDPYALLKHLVLDFGGTASAFVHGIAPEHPSPKSIIEKCRKVDLSSSDLISGLYAESEKRSKLGIDNTFHTQFDGALAAMAAKSDLKHKGSGRKQFSPTHLLAILKSSMINDEPRLNFDYKNFTIQCMHLDHKLMKVILPYMKLKGEHGTTHTLFSGIYDFMRTAADAKAHGRVVAHTPFAKAAAVMQSELESFDTKQFSKAALDASSGHIPKDLRPKIGKENPSLGSEVDELLAKYPGIAMGSSRDAFEFYDTAGSLEKFEDMLDSKELRKLMPDCDPTEPVYFFNAGRDMNK